jgi:hypothetical protein
MDPFPATQNHSMDGSSELGWLRSNGFGAMLVKDTTNLAKNGMEFHEHELNFQNPATPKPQITTLLQDSQPMDPLPNNHPKSFYGCIK